MADSVNSSAPAVLDADRVSADRGGAGRIAAYRVSPAAHLADRFEAAEVTGPRAIRIRELPFLTMIGLRALPGSAVAARFETVLGAQLPARCGQVTSAEQPSGGNLSVLWLSPDEFLVVGGPTLVERFESLVAALQGEPGSVTDLSANRTTVELTGPSARAVLEKGCPLDLHPRTLVEGTAFSTSIGAVPVILWKRASDSFWVLPRSSFADFVGRWLIDAVTEFGSVELS